MADPKARLGEMLAKLRERKFRITVQGPVVSSEHEPATLVMRLLHMAHFMSHSKPKIIDKYIIP